jgi:hypothetical protein
VTSCTRITGDTDWTVYVITTIREALAAALGLKPSDTKMLSKLDDALEAADLYDCASAAPEKGAEARSPAGKVKAVAALAATCGKDFAVDHAVKAVTTLTGLVSKTAGRFLEGRADLLLAVPDLMELGRGELTGLSQGMFSAAGLDTRLTIIPARFMNLAEASALPTTDLSNFTECQPLPAGVPLPAGAPPGIQCLAVVSADLDGDGKPDRLLVWESQPPDDIGGGPGDTPPQMGAVAYLDDGTFHLLEETPSSWKMPGSTTAEELRPARVVSLARRPAAAGPGHRSRRRQHQYRLLDLQWTPAATRTGKAASVGTHHPSDGSDCTNPDPRIAGRRSGRRRAPLDNGHIRRCHRQSCHAIGLPQPK